MPRRFEGNDAKRVKVARQQGTTLDRLRKAVEALDRENRDIQAEVEEFQGQIGGLRRSVADLVGFADDQPVRESGDQNDSLRGVGRPAGEVADSRGEDAKDALNTTSRDMA